MRTVLAASCAALLLAACGVAPINWQVALDSTELSVRERHFTYAYLNLRSTYANAPAEIRTQAVERARKYQQVVEAGYRDLAKESIKTPRDSRFANWLEFHRAIAGSVDETTLMADGRKFYAEDSETAGAVETAKAKSAAERLRPVIEEHAAAKRLAVFRCKGPASCDKAFALAQIFMNANADMKIQVATNTIVETYNPTDAGKVGMKIVKQPLSGDEAEVRLTATCRPASTSTISENCLKIETSIYQRFPGYMQSEFRP